LAQNYNDASAAHVWSEGDFSGDGRVDFNDLVLLAQVYNTALPGATPVGATAEFAPEFAADWAAAAVASVPEPSVVGAVVCAGFVLAGRRRPRASHANSG
jgi:hypothetical protein